VLHAHGAHFSAGLDLGEVGPVVAKRGPEARRMYNAPPAPLPRTLTLTLRGGFTVLDSQQRRLHDRARLRGYSDLHGYLLARCGHTLPTGDHPAMASHQHRRRAGRASRDGA
jgi:hypothetical protein